MSWGLQFQMAARILGRGKSCFYAPTSAELLNLNVTASWCRFGPRIYTLCDMGDSCILSLIMQSSAAAVLTN